MSQPRKLHLFNCDRTYKLDAVVDLLNATKAKSSFVHIEKHYFSLAEMSDMSTKILPKLQMDMAFFVVHAHESRLSINEDNAGIGYAKIYRALLKATGENVIIVIGGDDNYTNEDEEDRLVISRWARWKISSQFSEELLDGRKGFIFSWNKKHRPIHEEALMHYFDSSKKGRKFEYQPTKRKLPTKPVTPPPERSTKLVQPLRLYDSLPEDHLKYWLQESFASSSTDRQARKDNVPSDSAGRGEGPKIISQLRPDIWKTKPKDLAILGCGVSDESMKTVRRVFNDLRHLLSISTDTAVEKCSPTSAMSYLLKNTLRFCVLVVDGKTVKDIYERLAQGRAEYEELLRTAANKVVEKVVVVICDPCSLLSLRDEAFVSDAVGRVLDGTGKGLVVWVKANIMSMEPDALAQMITASASASGSIKSQTSYQGDFPRSPYTSRSPVSVGTERHEQPRKDDRTRVSQYGTYDGSNGLWNERNIRPQRDLSAIPAAPPYTTKKYTGQPIKLKTRLCFGNISYDPRDVEILDPEFEVPSHIQTSLSQIYFQTPEAVVEVVSDQRSGDLRWSVDTKSKGFFRKKKQESHPSTSTESNEPVPRLASNETFVLIARVRYGEVSMEKGDLELIYPEWETPKYLAETLRREHRATSDGKLFVISDEEGNLRVVVKVGKMSKALSLFNKTCGRSPRN